MKISREIIINGMSNNTEYELTGVELERCFNEYQSTHDQNEIIHQLKDLDYEDLENIPEDIIADLASQFREKIDNLMDDVAIEVIRKNEEVLKRYKTKWKVFCAKVTQTKERYYTIRAKDEREAEDLIANYLENEYDKANDDFEYEDAEYDTLFIDEDDSCDPDEAEIKGDDE